MGKEISSNLTALEHYYEKQDSATKACLFALKSIILSIDKAIVPTRKYQIPFFCYKEFNLGFLWVHKKKILVGFVEDKKTLPQSLAEGKKDKVFTLEINPLADIPVVTLKEYYQALINKYNNWNAKK